MALCERSIERLTLGRRLTMAVVARLQCKLEWASSSSRKMMAMYMSRPL